MNDARRRDRLITSPLGILAAGLLLLSVALNSFVGGGPDWFTVDGEPLYRSDLRTIGLSTDEGTMPSLAAPFVDVFPGAVAFSVWFLALAAWPVRLWARIAMATVLVLTAVLIVMQARDEAPGAGASTTDAYLVIGTGLVLAAVLAGTATGMLTRSRWVRCAAGAVVVLVLAAATTAGLVQLLGARDGLALTIEPIGFVLALLAAAASLVVMAVATRRHDRVMRADAGGVDQA
ncbi:hypothetical protein AERO_04440 [Aeromicrobium fastidiosum]|uniref:hypothetical protein n=1 Tax=Aeromicrobium fastidiosum TaxID=52699 RepID=UPI0020235F40|nr:hypothetical protein [Aeromicrobium fastidiosum]MCL8250623.1 hypothetical protein [Aeromicrobium fastidiosum]